MTFKNIHRRADLVQFQERAETTTSHAASQSVFGPQVQGPTGPLYTASSSTAASGSTTSSSSSASSVTSTTSAVIPTTSTTVPTTPPAVSTVAPAHVSNTPVVVATRTSSVTVHASSSTATATSTSADSSSGMGIGSIAAIGVAAIIGIGVITAFIIWRIRRRNKNHDIDEEPFNRNSFLRNSTAIPDDDAPPLSRTRPSPAGPAMSERTPTPLYGQQTATFGGDPSGFNYATQPSYGAVPGHPFNPNPFGPGGAPATPLPHSPGFGTAYDQQGFNQGGYQELTRGPVGMHEYPPSPASRGFDPQMENPHSPGYTGHESFPMPPGSPARFDERGHDIQHRSMTAQQGQVVSVSNSLHDGRETPVQLGFAPAAHAPHGAPAHGRAPGQRPDTIYDDDDAYGGI